MTALLAFGPQIFDHHQEMGPLGVLSLLN